MKHAMMNPIQDLVFWGFSYNFISSPSNWSLTLTRAKKKQRNTNQTDGEGGRGRNEGPAAGAQVSVAAQITCASTNGTDVRIMPPPRHDGDDDRRQC